MIKFCLIDNGCIHNNGDNTKQWTSHDSANLFKKMFIIFCDIVVYFSFI